jgi:hypothetical protein
MRRITREGRARQGKRFGGELPDPRIGKKRRERRKFSGKGTKEKAQQRNKDTRRGSGFQRDAYMHDRASYTPFGTVLSAHSCPMLAAIASLDPGRCNASRVTEGRAAVVVRRLG